MTAPSCLRLARIRNSSAPTSVSFRLTSSTSSRLDFGQDDLQPVAADLADRDFADALGVDAVLERRDQLVHVESCFVVSFITS